jgi:hypothetical protein
MFQRRPGRGADLHRYGCPTWKWVGDTLMLQNHDTLSIGCRSKTVRRKTVKGELKDYLVDHLECALILAGQRGLRLTTNLIAMAIESLKERSDERPR